MSEQPATDADSHLLPQGYLSTDGNQIVGADGAPVKIAAINWYGFETPNFAPTGLWAQDYETIMNEMVQAGSNTIRLPWSDQLFDPGSAPSGIDYSLNPGLQGLIPAALDGDPSTIKSGWYRAQGWRGGCAPNIDSYQAPRTGHCPGRLVSRACRSWTRSSPTPGKSA